jgi:hypothetical protein
MESDDDPEEHQAMIETLDTIVDDTMDDLSAHDQIAVMIRRVVTHDGRVTIRLSSTDNMTDKDVQKLVLLVASHQTPAIKQFVESVGEK